MPHPVGTNQRGAVFAAQSQQNRSGRKTRRGVRRVTARAASRVSAPLLQDPVAFPPLVPQEATPAPSVPSIASSSFAAAVARAPVRPSYLTAVQRPARAKFVDVFGIKLLKTHHERVAIRSAAQRPTMSARRVERNATQATRKALMQLPATVIQPRPAPLRRRSPRAIATLVQRSRYQRLSSVRRSLKRATLASGEQPLVRRQRLFALLHRPSKSTLLSPLWASLHRHLWTTPVHHQ